MNRPSRSIAFSYFDTLIKQAEGFVEILLPNLLKQSRNKQMNANKTGRELRKRLRTNFSVDL